MNRPFSSLTLLACAGVFASGVLVAACTNEADLGGRSADAGSQSTSPASLVEACGAYRSAGAARTTRCGSVADDEIYLDGFDAFCARLLAAPGVAVDMARFAACADKLRALPCDQSEREIAECDVLHSAKGMLPDGAACALDIQCASGSCAGGAPEAAKLRCGTCQPTAAAGEPCEVRRCASDAICTSSGAGASVCEAVLSEGEPCAPGDFCGFGAYCDASDEVCRRAPREGEACRWTTPTGSSTTSCAGVLSCIDGVCRFPRALGETCTADDDCDRGLACSTETKRCESTRVPLGGACGSEAKTSCDRGLACHEEACVEPLAPGAPCRASGIPCAPFHYCGPSVTCEPIDPSSCK